MRLALRSVPRINPINGTENGGGLCFCSAEETVRAAVESGLCPLLVADGDAVSVFLPPPPRATTVVLDGEDALPLFAATDGIGCVVAAGGERAMRAARLFAAVRRTPCALIPADASFDGVFGRKTVALAAGVRMSVPSVPCLVACDRRLLAPTAARAYGRLLLARLALFESRALRAVCKREVPSADPALFAGMETFGGEDAIVRSLALRAEEEEEIPREGRTLAERLGGKTGEWGAFFLLSSLYGAFFLHGKPRRYFVPDYAARARAEGVERAVPPTAEEYAARAFALEGARGALSREIAGILKMREAYAARMRALGGETETPPPVRLKGLAERCPAGLCAVLRDFGCMEFGYDET